MALAAKAARVTSARLAPWKWTSATGGPPGRHRAASEPGAAPLARLISSRLDREGVLPSSTAWRVSLIGLPELDQLRAARQPAAASGRQSV